MNYSTKDNIRWSLDDLSDESRVWIFQASRPLKKEEVVAINGNLARFLPSWTSHNRWLKAAAEVFHDRFVVVFLDEKASAGASGCSIDKLVHFIEALGNRLQLDLMNRLIFYIDKGSGIIAVPMHDLAKRIEDGTVQPDDKVYDNLVKTKGEWAQKWLVPLEKSWHKRFF